MQTVTMRRTALSSNSVTDTNRFVFCALLPPTLSTTHPCNHFSFKRVRLFGEARRASERLALYLIRAPFF